MKKCALIFLLQFVVSYSFAQWNVGVVGGYNYTGITFNPGTVSTTYSSSTTMKSGFNAGIVLEKELGSRVSFEPGVFYTSMGAKMQSSFAITSPSGNLYENESSDITLGYIQVPVNLIVKFPVKYGKFFVGAGPFISFNIVGNNDYANTSPNGQVVSGSDELATKYEVGVNGLAGFEFKNGLFLKAGYQYASNEITTYGDESIKNYGASISIGFTIKRAKANKE